MNPYRYFLIAATLVVSSVCSAAVVTIPDPALDAAIRDALVIPEPTPLQDTDLATITSLVARSRGIVDLTGIEYCTNLTNLSLDDNQISDITALSGLTALPDLDLSGNQISDITALSGLTNLEYLDLGSNQITDITALSGLTSLTALDLYYNKISDITALSVLTALTDLYLVRNQISDITALSGLTAIIGLFLSGNQISDITALSGLTALNLLDLGINQISDITALSGLPALTSLFLGGNQISDISALSGLTTLGILYLKGNQLSLESCTVHIPALKTAGVYVIYSDPCFVASEGEGETGVQSADRDANFVISLSELLRVIQFYNSGGLHCADVPTDTEDGFVPGAGANQTCTPYDTDYNPQDWVINLSEVLRIIQFYNMLGYRYCPFDGTEDGFCPGLV